jgi:signal transduction histidine kinase
LSQPAAQRAARAAGRRTVSSSEDPFAAIALPELATAARRVAASFRNESGDAIAPEEVRDILTDLAQRVAGARHDPAEAVDGDKRSVGWLGRRLLELLRAQLLDAWAAAPPPAVEVIEQLRALEHVRAAVEPAWSDFFNARLSGPGGLDLVVEVAHDLRSPLTSVLFLAETLQRGQSGPVNEVQHRQLGLIYGAALGLSAVTSDVIELARGGDVLVDTQLSPFSVTEILDSVKDIVSPIAEEKGLTVRVKPPASDHRLGHPLALSRVLLNLTTNALKFTDQGHVEITAVPLGRQQLEFSVRDTGRGISAEALETLYQPFRRTAARRGGYTFSGTGLGLAICRRLVEAMGSTLEVETRADWGTRFAFVLDLPSAGAL